MLSVQNIRIGFNSFVSGMTNKQINLVIIFTALTAIAALSAIFYKWYSKKGEALNKKVENKPLNKTEAEKTKEVASKIINVTQTASKETTESSKTPTAPTKDTLKESSKAADMGNIESNDPIDIVKKTPQSCFRSSISWGKTDIHYNLNGKYGVLREGWEPLEGSQLNLWNEITANCKKITRNP